MSNNTPGPWVISTHDDNGEIVIRGSEHGGHFIVANLEVDNYWDEPKERIMANANLIAAAPELLEALQDKGIKIAIGSASHNAPGLIKAMELEQYIDYIVNPSEVEKGKPAPDIFLKAAEVLGAKPEECIAIEDAVAGVKAIKSAQMYAVGIGDVDILNEADIIYAKTGDIDLTEILGANN